MLYHAQQNMPTSWLPGGFLGVEVFFAISGYLITVLLIGEFQRSGSIDLRGFWTRRARRLLPALFALLVVSIGVVGIGGHYSEALREHVRAFRGMWTSAWFYFTNWYQIIAGLNYAEHSGRPPLLRHLWSLAVEEQFYLFWPLIMIVVLVRWRDRLRMVAALFAGIAVVLAIGTALLFRPADVTMANALYLATPSRASGLLLGAALAAVWRPWESSGERSLRTRRLIEAGAIVGIVVLVATHLKWHIFVSTIDGTRGYALLFRGGFFIVGLATCAVIVAAVDPASFIGNRVLGSRPLVWIGKRSYGLYLWHWPVFQLTRPFGDQSLLDLSHPDLRLHWFAALCVRLAITVAITELSYRLIEMPLRSGSWRRLTRPTWASMIVGWVVVVSTASAFTMSVPLTFAATDQLAADAACNSHPETCGGGGPAPGATDAPVTSDAPSATEAPPTTGTPGGTDSIPTGSDSTIPASSAAPTSVGSASSVPHTGPIPLALGDSVMLAASSALRAAGIRVDAVIGREFMDAERLVELYRAKRQLGDVVVIGLGTGGGVSDAQIDRLMKRLATVPHVILITPETAGRAFELSSQAAIRSAATRYSNVSVIDWRELAQDKLKYSEGTPGVAFEDLYFYKDRIHLVSKGRRFFADLIIAEISRVWR
jgi:peptidoglycan/LPS O-acetylase OafA/YrhL